MRLGVKESVLLIFILTAVIYSNSLGGEFVYDDDYFVVKNVVIRNLENLPSFFTSSSAIAFADLSQEVYRPITTLSYAIDYFFWRLDAFGYHLVNLLVHSCNAVLLFLLLYLIFSNIPLALLASLLFASHPIQTEVVSWISGRSSVLFLFFYLLSFILYVLFLKKKRVVYFALSLASFSASLFSKEMAVTLPLILTAYEVHFHNGDALRKKAARILPYFILAALFMFVRFLVLKRVSQCGWWGGSPYYTFLTMSTVLADYIRLLVLPLKLCAFYITNIYQSVASARVFFSMAMLAILAAAPGFLFKYSKRLSFAAWWFFITLVPVSNIIPLKALEAERFLYLPSIGFCLALAILIGILARTDLKLLGVKRKTIAVCLFVLIIALYSVRTMIRNEDWKDTIAISKSIIKVSPLNTWGYSSLGTAYIGKERYPEAINPLKKAIALSKGYAPPVNALGFCYLEMGRYKDAIVFLEEALRLKPDNMETMNSLGVAYANTDRYEEAIKKFEASIKKDPAYVNAYLNLGTAYERKKEYDKAIKTYEEVALNTNGREDISVSCIRIGDVYLKTGLKDKARYYYEKAVVTCGNRLQDLKKVAEERMEKVR